MTYGGEPFEKSRWWKEKCLFILLDCLGKPESYLDVGCGDAYFIKLMGRLIGQENALGIDLVSPDVCVIAHDLQLPLDLQRKFDMVVSLEVGEHLPEESADTYCDTLAKHSGQWLVFSAAHIGQGGYQHINCQNKDYWLKKLASRGLKFLPDKTEQIASLWGEFAPCSWAYENLMIFGKEGSMSLKETINIGFCFEMNYGDSFNLSVMPYLMGDRCQLFHWRATPSNIPVYLGIGTLIDYMIRLGWLRGREVILLGTGTNNFGTPIGMSFGGFARGKLSAERLGVDAVGDLGILVDRVYGKPTKRDERLLLTMGEKHITNDIVDSLKCISPNIARCDANVAMALGGARGTYEAIATSQYIVTDKLHYAMTAEAVGIPWLIYHHHEGTLFEQPLRFNDWADMIGKSQFIISDLSQADIIKENNNFDRSEKQKDELEQRVRDLIK